MTKSFGSTVTVLSTMTLPGVAASDLTLVSRVFLGASIPGGGWVGQDAFQAFLDTEVTPLFRDGYTVLQGQGAWGDTETGATIKETTRVLEFAHTADDLAKIREVALAYKNQFDQQAVMVSTVPATVSFV